MLAAGFEPTEGSPLPAGLRNEFRAPKIPPLQSSSAFLIFTKHHIWCFVSKIDTISSMVFQESLQDPISEARFPNAHFPLGRNF
jgi:hypothetical protein